LKWVAVLSREREEEMLQLNQEGCLKMRFYQAAKLEFTKLLKIHLKLFFGLWYGAGIHKTSYCHYFDRGSLSNSDLVF
jgi:hypothetical protein